MEGAMTSNASCSVPPCLVGSVSMGMILWNSQIEPGQPCNNNRGLATKHKKGRCLCLSLAILTVLCFERKCIDPLDRTRLRPGKKMYWFWSSGGSILTQIKKSGPQNKYNNEENTESRIFFTCQSAESTFICILSCYMNVLSTGLSRISSFKTF